MKNLGVLFLFVVSLVALYFTLTWRQPTPIRVEPATAPPASAAARSTPPSAQGTDGGLRLEEKMEPLKALDSGKLNRQYRLGGTARR